MKTASFATEAIILKALSHPKRLEIVYLLRQQPLTASAIERMTGWPQANLSQHLRELKVAKVIIASRQGKHIYYRLAHPNFGQIIATLTAMSAPRPATKQENHRTAIQDPVCRMWVEPAAAKWQTIYKGATYFFCAAGCQKHFVHSPERYA